MLFNIRLLFLLLVCGVSHACDRYVIGFKGLNDVFDSNAFVEYSSKQSACHKAFSHSNVAGAVRFISGLNVDYQLYGFSAGARSVARVLPILQKQNVALPKYIITIGAYTTTDVNFDRYQIKYQNYFDASGIGQTSPGIMLNTVSHANIQKTVNLLIDF